MMKRIFAALAFVIGVVVLVFGSQRPLYTHPVPTETVATGPTIQPLTQSAARRQIDQIAFAKHTRALKRATASAKAKATAAEPPAAQTSPTQVAGATTQGTTTNTDRQVATVASAQRQYQHRRPTTHPASQYAANTLYINGVAIHYIQGSMANGAAPGSGAATWGGQAHYSNSSGQNTHFIGHNPGSFGVVASLHRGSQIIVTDAAGQPRTYTVYATVTVDDNSRAANGTDYWNQITGTGGGQRITLQTCIGANTNYIVFAQ
ncbi:sortase domain-containing protein [Lacticaseibacillus nasuensis]|uniref:sortase domain-containing protein n=1 Tax=Lacticaseibacillus nasuensis TaxID=944671 RepID=UPI0006CF4072